MKRFLVYLIVMFSLVSCERNDPFEYVSGSGLNFAMKNNSYGLSYNFATQSDPNAPVWDPIFYGDSLLTDTVPLIINLTGDLLPVDRSYKLKIAEGGDAGEDVRIEFLQPYTLQADKLRDTALIVLHRPSKRGQFNVPITFDTEDKDSMFGKGLVEQSVFTFTIADKYSKPSDWDANYWGSYSEEKYAFFVTVLHRLYSSWDSWMFADMRNRLNAALHKYNAANPDKVKDFTFPGYE